MVDGSDEFFLELIHFSACSFTCVFVYFLGRRFEAACVGDMDVGLVFGSVGCGLVGVLSFRGCVFGLVFVLLESFLHIFFFFICP